MNIQNDASKVGLMPYQYEYDKSLKTYSITIDLEMVGKDENFGAEADKEEKAARVKAILDAIETLSLVVKGNLDNAEPIFVVGGISDRKTHYFENVVHVEEDKLELSQDLVDKMAMGYDCGLLRGKMLANEQEIEQKLEPMTIPAFFKKMKDEIDLYYEV